MIIVLPRETTRGCDHLLYSNYLVGEIISSPFSVWKSCRQSRECDCVLARVARLPRVREVCAARSRIRCDTSLTLAAAHPRVQCALICYAVLRVQ